MSEQEIDQLKLYPKLASGVHLNLTIGSPLTKSNTLTDRNNNFISKAYLQSADINLNDIENELRAQINLYIERFNLLPSHLDSHHGIHRVPGIDNICKNLAQEYNIPLRENSPYQLSKDFFGSNATVENFKAILKQATVEKLEVMTHVGFNSLELKQISSYNKEREQEFLVLTNPEIQDFLKEHSINLENYSTNI